MHKKQTLIVLGLLVTFQKDYVKLSYKNTSKTLFWFLVLQMNNKSMFDWLTRIIIPLVSFYCPWNSSENQIFFVFRKYRKGPVAWNGLSDETWIYLKWSSSSRDLKRSFLKLKTTLLSFIRTFRIYFWYGTKREVY